MKHLFSSKKWFTLLEMLITMVIFFMMITVVTTIFIYVYKTKGALEARQTVTKESYFFLEKLQVMSKDYSIDYEEYWNRKNVWCASPQNDTWNMTGHCSMMTYYGNKNGIYANPDYHWFYYCSSIPTAVVNASNELRVEYGSTFDECLNNITGSVPSATILSNSGFIQSYGQYAKTFIDVNEDVDYITGAVKDDDDKDLWSGPIAIMWTATNYPQELYLISNDKTRRLFFRRKLVEQADYNSDGFTWDSEKLYAIQVLQLRWFDAWDNHDFDTAYPWVYDGVIDTWACDYSLWFICNGASISGAYPDFTLPLSSDDGWQNLLTNDITISQWNIITSPLIDPYLWRSIQSGQVSPFFSIDFTAKLYGKNRNLKIPRNQMDTYSLKLQTTLSSVFR